MPILEKYRKLGFFAETRFKWNLRAAITEHDDAKKKLILERNGKNVDQLTSPTKKEKTSKKFKALTLQLELENLDLLIPDLYHEVLLFQKNAEPFNEKDIARAIKICDNLIAKCESYLEKINNLIPHIKSIKKIAFYNNLLTQVNQKLSELKEYKSILQEKVELKELTTVFTSTERTIESRTKTPKTSPTTPEEIKRAVNATIIDEQLSIKRTNSSDKLQAATKVVELSSNHNQGLTTFANPSPAKQKQAQSKLSTFLPFLRQRTPTLLTPANDHLSDIWRSFRITFNPMRLFDCVRKLMAEVKKREERLFSKTIEGEPLTQAYAHTISHVFRQMKTDDLIALNSRFERSDFKNLIEALVAGSREPDTFSNLKYSKGIHADPEKERLIAFSCSTAVTWLATTTDTLKSVMEERQLPLKETVIDKNKPLDLDVSKKSSGFIIHLVNNKFFSQDVKKRRQSPQNTTTFTDLILARAELNFLQPSIPLRCMRATYIAIDQ